MFFPTIFIYKNVEQGMLLIYNLLYNMVGQFPLTVHCIRCSFRILASEVLLYSVIEST